MNGEDGPMKRIKIGSVGIVLCAGVVMALGTAASVAAQTAARSPEPQVTFTKDVATILQRSCQACHRPNNIAPMSLLTYEDARPWARSIRAKVSEREMPPWHRPQRRHREVRSRPSLTDEEIMTIVKWVDSGAPRGNRPTPPPRKFDDSDRGTSARLTSSPAAN
jgi:mono/diheme cytochrome c family protein